MGRDLKTTQDDKSNGDIDAFLKKVQSTPVARGGAGEGRLIFALDATASRQPTWDRASHIQREMFNEVADVGTLSLQISFFRGYGEFKATPWTKDSRSLTGPMSRVNCLGGYTQIKKVLKHALQQHEDKSISALVFVGDCVEEDVDDLCHLAGEMGLKNIPIFIFQEGYEPTAENCFRQMARLSGGAFCHFDEKSADRLKDLLKAVAIYAVGGRKALSDYGRKKGSDVTLLLEQLK
ncbi:VWA domain-containing protein [Sneathiella sp. P13V-1]|uniref:VWA domain-containing protein n=1 Tax=Sneathiella sp. P13V-1 TaxID=2697366 RepID=UPI00187B29FC|nr:VWA domain-containing protein [Sneathiella sp. P13V-1]MBE7636839.1 VWA domain-containing protein [Sneathiella sp. P13V-1]